MASDISLTQDSLKKALQANSADIYEFLAIIILGTLLLLDILTTGLVLAVGGYETNVFMKGIVQIPMVHLLLKWLVLVFVVIMARFCNRFIEGTGIYVLAVIIGWYSFVIANNTLVFLHLIAGST
ncbi:MAG: hypothetical protein A4E42_01117 [Methanoregulaceae archaeon PtaU1.Bin222]|nr:MAG: hypothetical protein A4E42_01117 [Methanoregulaceae archaeon PtaU1.Bin222]